VTWWVGATRRPTTGVDVEGRSTEDERMVTKDTGTGLEALQLLVVADTWCDPQHACDEVWQTLRNRRGKVFVVTPALTGRLHSLVSDIDQELAAAEQRLNQVLTQLRERGYIAGGRVGDQDPLLAVKDPLYQFQADEILVVATTATDESWVERSLLERATDLGLPVSCVRVAEAVR
jgi:GABA permease